MKSEGGYTRALLKLSGDAFGGAGVEVFDEGQITYIADELRAARQVCPQLALVVGGGNIMRGAQFRAHGPGRLRADYAGMTATVVNALVLQDGLERADIPSRVYSALPVTGAAEPFDADRCRGDLDQGRVVILAGGTGNPLFTTDTAAALRAIQVGASLLLKATRVDGVFSADPEKDPDAEFFEHLEYEQVLERRLGVMDLCAVSLCMQHRLPVRVINYREAGNIRRALAGESIGTLIGNAGNGHG